MYVTPFNVNVVHYISYSLSKFDSRT